MKTTTTTEAPRTTMQTPKMPRSAAPLDNHVAQVLRALGEAAIRLADGQAIDDLFAIHYGSPPMTSATSNSLLTVPEACTRLRISRWMFYRLIHQQRIATITIGRRRLVSARDIERFLNGVGDEGGAK